MERTDTFHFNTDPSPAEGREWGTAVIQVDDKQYEFPVPSSLFKHGHGITDPGNKQRLPR